MYSRKLMGYTLGPYGYYRVYSVNRYNQYCSTYTCSSLIRVECLTLECRLYLSMVDSTQPILPSPPRIITRNFSNR